MQNTEEILINLIRVSLNNDCDSDGIFVKDVNWSEVLTIASNHGISAVVFSGMEKLMALNQEFKNYLPKTLLLQWYGLAVRQATLSKKNRNVADSLSSLLIKNGIEAVVLKGLSIAQYYPTPDYRNSCDIDLFVDGDNWTRACQILETKGIRLEREVYKEVEFMYDGVYVEMHRYITPVRGNKTLLCFEKYLRSLLEDYPKTYFKGTRLLCPPLMFIVMLFIEHALGDLLHGKLTLKHLMDWVVLRKQGINRPEVENICKDFGFYRFLMLIDALADAVEGKVEMESLAPSYREVMDSFFDLPKVVKSKNSWFARRVSLFFNIIRNRRYYQSFGYCSMESFLFNAVWTHFFDKKVRL